MLIYKQRYKPRTSREFTKSDLTVYDSAGNTALNALTVYGKSEVVDGSIVSAGEGGNISTRTEGKNSLEITATTQTINGITFTVNSDKTITVSGTATAITKLNIGQYLLMGRTKRYLSGATINGSIDTIRLGFAGYGFINTANTTLTLNREDSDTNWDNFVFIEVDEGYTANNVLFKPMISYTDDINYEPYGGSTMATFSTGTPLRGITGGARDVAEWDGTSGEVTKNCGVDDLGIRTWNVSGSADHSFYIGIENRDPLSNAVITNLVDYTQVYSIDDLATTNKSFLCRIGTTALIFRNTAYTEPADFKTSMNGKMLIYKLATPTTQSLTSTENTSIAALRTFAPNTHVQNNAGTDMTVDYTIRAPTI